MEEKIKELTLLMLYLTSWEEQDEIWGNVKRSWKGYPFGVLDDLIDKEYIIGSKRAKSVFLTDRGIKEAEKLVKKYMERTDE